MILNVEPGGWRPENAIPAKARISPVFGLIATTPPSRLPSAAVAARCTGIEIVVRTAWPCCALVWASTVVPASSVPPGRPISRRSKIRSRPLAPTVVVAGMPRSS